MWPTSSGRKCFRKADLEAKALEPYLSILNAGKGSEESAEAPTGFAGLRKSMGSSQKPPPDARAVEAAAENFHAWLSKDQSPLRGVLYLLSGAGVFFAAHAAEKTARGWVLHKPASKDDAIRAAKARISAKGPDDEEGGTQTEDTSGLFAD